MIGQRMTAWGARRAGFVVLAGLLLTGVLGARPAEASLSFCNHTVFVLEAASALPQPDGWKVEGWTRLRPGECRQILKRLSAVPSFYVYAEAHEAHQGAMRRWAGRRDFCVQKKNFSFSGPNPCEAGSETRPFFRVQIEAGAKEWVHRFREPTADLMTLREARVGGVQRLLLDNGYDQVRMDGYMGRRTRRAAAKAASDLGVTDVKADSFDFIDALLRNLETVQTKRGFRFCNETKHEVFAAVAFEVEGAWSSRGWWSPEPGTCVKAIKDKLPNQFVYVYAAATTKVGEEILWSGEYPFCISDVKFEIEGTETCESRGYETAEFIRIDTGEKEGWDFALQDDPREIGADDIAGPETVEDQPDAPPALPLPKFPAPPEAGPNTRRAAEPGTGVKVPAPPEADPNTAPDVSDDGEPDAR